MPGPVFIAQQVIGLGVINLPGNLPRLLQNGLTVDPDGPLWYRGLAEDNEEQAAAHLEAVLKAYGVSRIVIGHTVTEGTVMPRFGGRVRDLPLVWQESDLTLQRYFDETAEGIYSWTWSVDPHELTEAIDATRAWALERFGSLDRILEPRFRIAWRAYDVTG